MDPIGTAEHSNGTATPERQRIKDNKDGKKRTPKRKGGKNELMSEQKVDKYINIRQRIISAGHEIEDEEFDLNDMTNFDACTDRLKMWDQCLANAVRLEQQLLPHVLFDDVENEAQQNDLLDMIQQVEPIFITNTGLEPLNAKLTEFINNPLHVYVNNQSDNVIAPPRAITSINHTAPSFKQIKQMVEEIRAAGDCPLVDILAPSDNSLVYDAFVCKVLADLLDILKRQRFETNMELIELDARQPNDHHQQQQHCANTTSSAAGTDGAGGTVVVEGGPEEQQMAGPSCSSDQQQQKQYHIAGDGTRATSTHEKFLEAIQKGEIQREGDEAVADAEDLGDYGEEDESEAGSDDCIETTFSSTTDTTVVVVDAATPQQQQQEQQDIERNGDDMETLLVDDGHSTAAAATTVDNEQPTTTQMPPTKQQHLAAPATVPEPNNNLLASCDDHVDDHHHHQQQPTPSSSTQSDDNKPPPPYDEKSSNSVPTTTLGLLPTTSLSSSEKVRLQQHQLNKLFSSAGLLCASPLVLSPPSPSVIRSEIVDLTLHEKDDEDEDNDISNDGSSSDLEIIDDSGMGGSKEDDDVELVDDTSTSPAAEKAKRIKLTMSRSGGRGRKRKLEDDDEQKTDTTEVKGKRRKRDDTGDDANDDEEEEASTDVVEDSDEEEDYCNGRRPLTLADNIRMKTEEGKEVAAPTATIIDDEDDEEVQMGEEEETVGNDGRRHQQRLHQEHHQMMDLDDDSIICLSDG